MKKRYDLHGRRSGVYRKPSGWAQADPTQTLTVMWDTAVNGWGRVASTSQGGVVESYEYTVGGLVTKKRLGFDSYDTALEAVYSWNQSGQMTAMKYPDVYNADGTVAATGRTLNYAYGYLGAPSATTDLALPAGSQTVASGVWNGAGQLTQLSVRKPDGTMDVESFTYNERGQLLQQSGRGVNIEYRYSLTANDGRLVSRKDNVSGEEVVYEYDLLGRLLTAATTGSGGWGLSWSYDGFGNRLTQGVTKGTGPVVNLSVDATKNQISSAGFVYDQNGNQTQWPVGAGTATASYDAQNRMTSVSTANGTEGYAYSAANQRVLVARAGGTETLFYGLGGELLGIYGRTVKANGKYYVSSVIGTRVWFAGRMIESNGSPVVRDRLGSVEKNGSTMTRYYPYGEEQGGASGGSREKFATYSRDAVSGLDYAWNRYYSSTWGRFTSADPYVMSGGLGNPQGWNRYSYVEGDPVNRMDPNGLESVAAENGCYWDTATSTLSCNLAGTTVTLAGDFDAAWAEKKGFQRAASWGAMSIGLRRELLSMMMPNSVMTAEQRREVLRENVRSGVVSDCEALSLFAQGAAYSANANGGVAEFVKQFGVFIPSTHLMVKAANFFGISIDSTASANGLDPRGGISGYKAEYQDISPDTDQAHHFSGYFQFGYKAGATWSALAAHATEQIPFNPGDINLGKIAAQIGADLAGGMSMFDVAGRISKLCK